MEWGTKQLNGITDTPSCNGSRKKSAHPESKLQQSCVRWFKLQYPNRIIFAIPNAGARTKTNGARMKAEGMKEGVADLFIPEPSKPYIGIKEYHGMFIEMKAGKGKTTPNQCEFLLDMQKRGYRCEVCNSLDEFMKVVKEYFGLEYGKRKQNV